jgi:hypothetical protein
VERVRADADGVAAAAQPGADTVTCFPTHNDPAQWPLCRLLLPHQQVLLMRVSNSATDRTATLLNSAGSFLLGGDAARLCRSTGAPRRLARARQASDTLTSVNNLAHACKLWATRRGLAALPARARRL